MRVELRGVTGGMRRREFVALLGGAAAWPCAARAQRSAMPIIGFLSGGSRDFNMAARLRAFSQGLNDAGYIEGENVAIEYRWAEGRYDRLPQLVSDFVSRPVSVVVATGSEASAIAAEAATTTIPIVFGTAQDPVKLGLVASLSRPGGNATGVNFFVDELASKQLGLIKELNQNAARVALLVNPNAPGTALVTKDAMAGATATGLQIDVVQASDIREIETVFASLSRKKPDAVLIGADAFFFGRRLQLATLATRYALPAVYNAREYAEAGGLMSYGTNIDESYRQIGVYAGRILKGAKPAELPVVQSSKFELVINRSTARALNIDIPPGLLARADEVIE
jgi:putative ABC transport system substrate-binding protein